MPAEAGMTIPTEGETYSKLMEHLRQAQECAAMMAHLHNANDHREAAKSWLVVSENFRKMQRTLTELATRKLN
jgi:hypothetical protein